METVAEILIRLWAIGCSIAVVLLFLAFTIAGLIKDSRHNPPPENVRQPPL